MLGLKFSDLFMARPRPMGLKAELVPHASLTCVLCYFFEFLTVLGLKTKKRDIRPTGHLEGSCRFGPKIKFLDCERRKAHSGQRARMGLERARAGRAQTVLGRPDPMLTQPMPISRGDYTVIWTS